MKIAIDLGHGVGQDRGAAKFITEEEIINSVGGLVINKLKVLGHEVIEVRPTSATSVSNSLVQRVQKANNNNVELYVSIHANAGGGKGTEVFTYRGQEKEKARNVLNNIVQLGFTNRGIKGSNLYVINNTNMEAMLIEVCFVDTQSDVDLYNSLGAEKIADAIVKGLTGSTVSVTNSTPSKVTSTQKGDNWVSRLQQECNVQGFSNQTVDGIPGPNTLAGCPTIKIGARGKITGLLQEKLNSLGFSCGNVDEIFGENTRQAVMRFQSSRGLLPDGVVGPNTWRKLLGI